MIGLSVPNLKGNELKYVTKAIETEWVSTAGPYVKEFEKMISEYVGMPEAVACQSGTSGIHLALQTLGVERGDEVIVPTLTFIAAVNPVKYLEAEPIFMDCDDSLTIDPDKLEKFCAEECTVKNDLLINNKTGKIIKAIVVVHVFGNLADMEKILNMAKKYHVKVMEDATEALGSRFVSGKFAGRFAGTMGDIGVYSFNGNKIITTGGGGMIVSSNKAYLDKCRYLSTQCKDDVLYFVHNEVGYNYRMTNIQAALGLAQLEQLEGFIEIKEENYKEYIANGLELLPFRKGTRPNYWFYSLLTKNRDSLIEALDEEKIQTRPIWKLNHTQKMYKSAQAYRIEKAEEFYDTIVNIPCSTNLKKADVDYVSEKIKNII